MAAPISVMETFDVTEVTWEYEETAGRWVRLMPELGAQANQCVKEKATGFFFAWPYHGDGSFKSAEEVQSYEVDLQTMMQKNVNNGTTRRIRPVALLVLKP